MQTLRAKFPNVTVILADVNGITAEQNNKLKGLYDYIITFNGYVNINGYTFTPQDLKTHANKSFSETAMLYGTVLKIKEMNLEYDYLWKMTARYYFLPQFDIHRWPVRNDVIVSPQAINGVANNILYSVPRNMVDYFQNRLAYCSIKCFNDGDKIGHCVEDTLFDFTNPNVHLFIPYYPIYLGGICAVSEDKKQWYG